MTPCVLFLRDNSQNRAESSTVNLAPVDVSTGVEAELLSNRRKGLLKILYDVVYMFGADGQAHGVRLDASS